MTEKQYKLEQWSSLSLYYSFPDGNLHHSIGKVIARVENDLNSLYNENEQLKQQLNRLYNYFEDWYSDMTSANDFSEIWDNVKEDERWGDVE